MALKAAPSSAEDEAGAPGLASGASLDWPLSREEKKSRVMQFYDRDVHAADRLLEEAHTKLMVLQEELVSARRCSSTALASSASNSTSGSNVVADGGDGYARRRSIAEAAECMRRGIAQMESGLQARKDEGDDPPEGDGLVGRHDGASRPRLVKSEEAARTVDTTATPPSVLCRACGYLHGEKGRRVSFDDQVGSNKNDGDQELLRVPTPMRSRRRSIGEPEPEANAPEPQVLFHSPAPGGEDCEQHSDMFWPGGAAGCSPKRPYTPHNGSGPLPAPLLNSEAGETLLAHAMTTQVVSGTVRRRSVVDAWMMCCW